MKLGYPGTGCPGHVGDVVEKIQEMASEFLVPLIWLAQDLIYSFVIYKMGIEFISATPR